MACHFAISQKVSALRPLCPRPRECHHRSSAAHRQGSRTFIPPEYFIHVAKRCSGTAISTGIAKTHGLPDEINKPLPFGLQFSEAVEDDEIGTVLDFGGHHVRHNGDPAGRKPAPGGPRP